MGSKLEGDGLLFNPVVPSPHKRSYGAGMSDSTQNLLRPGELGAVLGIRERMTHRVLGELEALGFRLEQGPQGVRLCPVGLAAAVKAARERGQELSALRLNPAMTPYLNQDAQGAEPDALSVLIYAAAELAIVREGFGVMATALNNPVVRAGVRPFSWTNAGLPDPRNGL